MKPSQTKRVWMLSKHFGTLRIGIHIWMLKPDSFRLEIKHEIIVEKVKSMKQTAQGSGGFLGCLPAKRRSSGRPNLRLVLWLQ